MQIEKIIKLLNLTQSPNDNEALSAIRRVNQMLKESNKGWTDLLLSGPVAHKPPPVSTDGFAKMVHNLYMQREGLEFFDRMLVERAFGAIQSKRNIGKTLRAQIEFIYQKRFG